MSMQENGVSVNDPFPGFGPAWLLLARYQIDCKGAGHLLAGLLAPGTDMSFGYGLPL
jgi:hypothetical protein